jgi:hypothetical protein
VASALTGSSIEPEAATCVLGSVAEMPTRNEAQALLDQRMRSANQGTTRPAAFVTFGAFVEEQWKPLVFPTFKASTQHGYKTVLSNHVLPAWKDWRLRDIERLAIQQWVADKFRQATGWQTCAMRGCCCPAFSRRPSSSGFSKRIRRGV